MVGEQENIITCPSCGMKHQIHEPAIRQGYVNGMWITDVGWRCISCKHEWGFELLRGLE